MAGVGLLMGAPAASVNGAWGLWGFGIGGDNTAKATLILYGSFIRGGLLKNILDGSCFAGLRSLEFCLSYSVILVCYATQAPLT